jgi:hypothetical protein
LIYYRTSSIPSFPILNETYPFATVPRFHATDKTNVTAFPDGLKMLIGNPYELVPSHFLPFLPFLTPFFALQL